jgi:IclR helix-turn-helix domain
MSQSALRMRAVRQPQLIWASLWHGFDRNGVGSNRAPKAAQRRGPSSPQCARPGEGPPSLTWSSLWLGPATSGETVHAATPRARSQTASNLRSDLAKAVKASKAPAISRAMAVLRLLGSTAEPWGMQAIARELGMVPSTCHYVLRALIAEKLICFDPASKRYFLEPGIFMPARSLTEDLR